jgi:hypothetical protein
LAGSVQSIQEWHADVNDHNIGLQFSGFVDGGSAIGRFGADFPAQIGLYQRNHALPYNIVVVGDKNS